MRDNQSNNDRWIVSRNKKFGVAIFNFHGASKQCLDLDIGDCVHILEENADWFRGFCIKNRSKIGIFPINFIALKPHKIENEGLLDTIIPLEDSVCREVVKSLREWHLIWKNVLYLKGQYCLFEKVGSAINDLVEWRRQIITATLTQDQIKEIKCKITRQIDLGNRLLELDLIPRKHGRIVDPESISPIELYRIHNESSCALTMNQRSSNSSNCPAHVFVSNFLYLRIKDIALLPSFFEDDFEFTFSIFDYNSSSYLSEKYVAIISRGNSNDINKLNLSTIFTDLTALPSSELCLHIQALRLGKMLIVEGKSSKTFTSSSTLPSSLNSNSNAKFKRPFAGAIVNFSEMIKSESPEKEYTAKLFTCNNESDFYQIHDMLYKKQTSKLTQYQNCFITISIKLLSGLDTNKVMIDNPLIFKSVSCLTAKRGFPDVIMPGDVRNDLYLVLDSGDFEKGGKSIPKNIEASIILLGSDALPIKESISYGCGVDRVTKYTSLILYHSNNPRWMEMLKVLIPLEVFDLKAHIRIEFRHCSTKGTNNDKEKDKYFLGFSFIPLSDEQGTIIKDGHHELYIYKPNLEAKSSDIKSSEIKNRLNDPPSYLFLPFGPKDNRRHLNTELTFFTRSSKESIHVRTLLCSTKLTQNGDLLSLLKWRANPETVQDALNKVRRLNGEELVKFLQDILDALFSMFSTHDGNQTNHSGLVFEVLLHILSLLEDPKYEHFKPVLDTYINGHFAAALVYKGLLWCLKQYTDHIKDCESQETAQTCFRSLEWIFKFIVQSRILYARATGDHSNEDVFKKDLLSLFDSFHRMLSINYEPSLVQSQVTFLENFSSAYNQLLRVLLPMELTSIIKMIVNCLPFVDPVPAIISTKLKCIHDTINNEMLLRDLDARRELINVFSRHLKDHINRQQNLKLCARIISDILVFLHNEKMSIASGTGSSISGGSIASISQEVELLVINLLEPLVRVIVELSNSSSGSINSISTNLLHSYVSSFITLLRLMDENHFSQLLDMRNRKEKKELLLQVFYVFKQVFQPEIYSKDWAMMKMTTNYIVLCSLQEFSNSLIKDFLGDGKGQQGFDVQLWNSFFNLSVSFLTQSSLQLENFSEAKREAILEKYQDMRVQMGFLILSMWEKLGDLKVHFIPSMVAPFLEVTLVPAKELRKATLPIFYDMIDAEFKSDGNFKQVESKLIDKLDILVSENRGDDEFKQLFNAILLEKVYQQNPIWKDQGIQMIHSITKLLELLLDYRYVMTGDENRDKRMSCTVNLLNFYKDEINRKEMYIRYIYKLCDLHIPAENYAEAAFTLKLHADLLNWSFNIMARDSFCPAEQPEWQRKEALYLAIIDYFDKGKCWEEGIPLIEELALFYHKKLFDYAKLSMLLRREAEFFDNIRTKLRPEPEYFRVAFYGKGFPIFLRNKVFVYRGLEYEKIGEFTARLQTEFPQSHLLTKNGTPDAKIFESDEQYLQICNVKPVTEDREEFLGLDVPEKVMEYYLVNDVKKFTYDRPVLKGPVEENYDFKSLWIERTTLKISEKLPGILRWFEVKGKPFVTELSPVEHACDTIENMNRELQKLISSYTSEPTKPLPLLTMRLQGVIEAPVNGGILKYQDAFFNFDYTTQSSSYFIRIKEMKQLILRHIRLLEGGLSLHSRLAPSDVQPLHKLLVDKFTSLKQAVLEKNSRILDYQRLGDAICKKASIINTPLPPPPIEARQLPSTNTCLSIGKDDQIYSVPQDYSIIPTIPSRNSQTPPPPPPLRPRSSGFVNGECIARQVQISLPVNGNQVQRSRSIPRGHHLSNYICNGNGISPTKLENVPPLPPRISTIERRSTVVPVNITVEDEKPALPKRSIKKANNVSGEQGSLTNSIEQDNEDRIPPPLPLKRQSTTIITIGSNDSDISVNSQPTLSINSNHDGFTFIQTNTDYSMLKEREIEKDEKENEELENNHSTDDIPDMLLEQNGESLFV